MGGGVLDFAKVPSWAADKLGHTTKETEMPKPYHTPKSERDEVLGALEEAEGLDLAEVRRLARERARSIRLRREHGRERGPGRKAAPSLRLEVEA